MSARLLLLTPATSYRVSDFLEAARQLGVEAIVGSNQPLVIDRFSSGRTVSLNFNSLDEGVARIVDHARHYPVNAVIGVDEETTLLASAASEALQLPHNSADSVRAAHNKYRFRTTLAQAGLRKRSDDKGTGCSDYRGGRCDRPHEGNRPLLQN